MCIIDCCHCSTALSFHPFVRYPSRWEFLHVELLTIPVYHIMRQKNTPSLLTNRQPKCTSLQTDNSAVEKIQQVGGATQSKYLYGHQGNSVRLGSGAPWSGVVSIKYAVFSQGSRNSSTHIPRARSIRKRYFIVSGQPPTFQRDTPYLVGLQVIKSAFQFLNDLESPAKCDDFSIGHTTTVGAGEFFDWPRT